MFKIVENKQNDNNKLTTMLDLEKRKNLFQVINDFIDCIIVILDQAGRIVYCNNFCEKLIKMKFNQIQGKFYWDIFCLTEEKELYKAFFAMIDPTQCPVEIESQVSVNQGPASTILWKHNVLQDQNGTIDYHVLSGKDITAYQQANRELQDIGEKYRTIIHVSPVSVISLDTNCMIKSWSAASEKLLGWTENNTLDKDICQFLNDQNGTLRYYFEKAIEGNITNDLELACTRKNGSPVNLSIFLSPMRDHSGLVEGIVLIALDITERKQIEERLKYLSFHDSLTGIYNRSYFENELEKLEGSREYPVAIISADLDGLKLVNDIFGHKEGDQYLKSCAALLQNILRDSDILARVGGDEFALILPRTNQNAAKKLITRIRNLFDQYNEEHTKLPLSISLGMAVSNNSKNFLEDIYTEADRAMYKDKLQRSNESRSKIVKALLSSHFNYDGINEGENEEVQLFSFKLGKSAGLAENQMADLALLAQIYNLGKIAVPDHILNKKGKLTEQEWEVIRQHVEKGYRISYASPELSGIADLLLKYREKWDGSGYPLGIKQKEIPPECRILSIVDAYIAMINDRPYRKAKKANEALEEIKYFAGTQFDPELVDKFSTILQNEAGIL